MPKYSREMEDKIIALFEQGKRNSVISRELSIYRGALQSRRKEWEKRKQEQEKPEPEKTIQQEQNDSHPLDSQIYTLIRYQGTHSREEALSQAIETQHSFNPYILNHGLRTPKDLIKFFKDKIKKGEESVNELKEKIDDLNEKFKILQEDYDSKLDSNISLRLALDRKR